MKSWSIQSSSLVAVACLPRHRGAGRGTRSGLALDVAGVRERHDHVRRRDQVLGAQLLRVVLDHAAAGAELGLLNRS